MQYEQSCSAFVVALLFLVSGAVQAQGGTGWAPFLSVTPVYQGKAHLDDGGDFSAWTMVLRAGAFRNIGSVNRVGLTLNYDYTDYGFSSPAAFGSAAPWGIIRRYGVATPLSFNLNNGWFLGLAPSVDWIHENGAGSGDSLTWGGIVTVTRVFGNGNRIGFGFGAFERFDDTSAFPLLIVNWTLSERLRLVNPLPAGPTGPAGVELDYRFDGGWSLGIGVTWRTMRFRLSDSGPAANGIGEERGVPVFLRATRNIGPILVLNLYGGLIMAGELRVEERPGTVLSKAGFDPAALLGATISARL